MKIFLNVPFVFLLAKKLFNSNLKYEDELSIKMKLIANVKDIIGYISLPINHHFGPWLVPKWRIFTSHTYKILKWDMS